MALSLLAAAAVAAVVGYELWDQHRTRRAWDDAQQALARRDLSTAADHFDRYLSRRPNDPAGWFQAARTARRRGHLADARRYLGEYDRRGGAPDAVQLERDLQLVQQGVGGAAEARLRATIDPLHPDARFVLEALARGFLKTERWADARQACELWRAIEPEAPWAWLWTGWVAERMVQVEGAAEFYTRALELAPSDRDVRLAFARIQLRQRDPTAAAPHFDWVLARDSDDAEALLGLAQCRLEAGQAAEAVPLIDRAAARDPGSTLAMGLRGRAAMDLGDPAGAERWLREAIRAEPSDVESLHLLVLALRSQRKDDEAARHAARLETLRQDLRRLTELLRTIRPELTDPAPCHDAGVIALRVGRTPQGLNLFQEALRRQPDHRPTHAALSDHYRRSGRLDLAEVHQSLANKP